MKRCIIKVAGAYYTALFPSTFAALEDAVNASPKPLPSACVLPSPAQTPDKRFNSCGCYGTCCWPHHVTKPTLCGLFIHDNGNPAAEYQSSHPAKLGIRIGGNPSTRTRGQLPQGCRLVDTACLASRPASPCSPTTV